MNKQEKEAWVTNLWGSSVGMALIWGVVIGSGGIPGSIAAVIVASLWFGITFVSWLFRYTYVAGKRSKS